MSVPDETHEDKHQDLVRHIDLEELHLEIVREAIGAGADHEL